MDIIKYGEIPEGSQLGILRAVKAEPGESAHMLDADAWNELTFMATPDKYLEYREGSQGKMLEYVKQFYVLRMLNKLFPGWEVKEGWKMWYQPEVRTWIMTGDLEVEYYSKMQGRMVKRTVPGIGSTYVQKSTTGDSPSQPEDMARGTRTEFIKNAAYWLGIGFDVYSQEIPMAMREQFETTIHDWVDKSYVLAVAETIRKKDAFKPFINNLPNVEQTAQFIEITKGLAAHIQAKLWKDYQRYTVLNVQAFIDTVKSKIKPKEGA